jgi:hypothetical protein
MDGCQIYPVIIGRDLRERGQVRRGATQASP